MEHQHCLFEHDYEASVSALEEIQTEGTVFEEAWTDLAPNLEQECLNEPAETNIDDEDPENFFPEFNTSSTTHKDM